MPQGAVRRKPNGRLAGRRPGTRRSRDLRTGQTRNIRIRDTTARGWTNTARQLWDDFRWRNVPTPKRRPNVPPGRLSVKRAKWHWAQGRKALHRHKRMAAAWGLGLGTAELAGYATLRTTGLVLGLASGILAALSVGVLSRTHHSTRSASSAGRRR